ncbi:hypothetical protein [Streptomyces qinglanensis]|uniref:Uncharacterized protein n=1 Tax=Streptomyces qinglanensis TaxID=943816 RepID=A0A1H9PLK6_9ACTN|nr:hypothetical protein [Streptomyces qinglanensis]SER49206.1 hypothetical protein SAMN05421870_102116 [Streptomyces qinglanensis]
MHGGARTVRGTGRAAAVLVTLLLALCGTVQLAGARGAQPAGAESGTGQALQAARTAVAAPYTAGPEVPYAAEAVRYAAAPSAGSGDRVVSASDDADPHHCHRSKGGGGALPAAPVGSRQLLSLALPVCLIPQSHSAIGAAHARPPVRGPAPIPPPTPVELSVLRV